MGKTLRRCDSSRWICLTWKVITRYGFHFFFSLVFELQISKFQNPLVMVLSDAPSRRLAPPPGMTAQINICGELAEKVVRLLLRKIIYDWPAGYSGCLGFSEWRLPELDGRCRNRSDLVGACYDHYVNRFFGAPAALVGSLFTIERNRSGRLCFALFGLSRPITISRAQKDSRRVGDNFGVVLLCFTNLVWQIWKGFRTVRYLILGGFVLFFWRLLDSLRFDLDK